jgi:hypothetical protein
VVRKPAVFAPRETKRGNRASIGRMFVLLSDRAPMCGFPLQSCSRSRPSAARDRAQSLRRHQSSSRNPARCFVSFGILKDLVGAVAAHQIVVGTRGLGSLFLRSVAASVRLAYVPIALVT